MKQSKLTKKEMSELRGGSVFGGQSATGKNNKNSVCNCTCEYPNSGSLRNINDAPGCRCICY